MGYNSVKNYRTNKPNPIKRVNLQGPPGNLFLNFTPGDEAYDEVNQVWWKYLYFDSSINSPIGGGVWGQLATVGGDLDTLSDTAGTTVSPTLPSDTPPNNIQLTNLDGSMNIVSDAANNRIVLSANNSGQNWTVVTVDQTASDNQGYFTNAAGNVNIALPASSLVGDTFEVCQMSSSGSWTITQAAGQSITLLNLTSTVGVGGSVASTSQGAWIKLVCNVADLGWFGTMQEGVATVV